MSECLPYAGRIEVVPHGLLRAVPAAERAAPPRPDEPLRVGTFGSLVAEKGIYELIRAAQGLPLELHLFGPWIQPEFGARMRELAAAGGIRLVEHGAYAAADPHPARNLHLAVFPSRCQETYGLVVDEALAHGVPALVSDRGAFAERRGQPGVEVAALETLADALRMLVGSPARLAALRQAIPAQRPTIAGSAARHLDLYREIA